VRDEFRPEAYQDGARKRLLEVIQQKVDGQEITLTPGEPPRAQIIDLMQALKASLGMPEKEAAQKAPAAEEPGRKPARPAAPAATNKTADAAEGRAKKRASR
jgi:DNA end-binding protein Ku